jgi:hypothetical protein
MKTFAQFYGLGWNDKLVIIEDLNLGIKGVTIDSAGIDFRTNQIYHEFTQQPFKPELIMELFEGWEIYSDEYSHNDCPEYVYKLWEYYILFIRESHYTMSKKGKFPICNFLFPRTLDDFIGDCQRGGIELKPKKQVKNG